MCRKKFNCKAILTKKGRRGKLIKKRPAVAGLFFNKDNILRTYPDTEHIGVYCNRSNNPYS